MSEEALRRYLELSHQDIREQLLTLLARPVPVPGRRQRPFLALETLLCYGLFSVLNPHRYGGGNIDSVPAVVKTLAVFFRRSPASLTSKMLNLDGSRAHSAHEEPFLFATLASHPLLYPALYTQILSVARSIGIDEETFPDFLGYLTARPEGEELLGQDDLPVSVGSLLKEKEADLQEMEQAFALGERLTEALAERKVRLAQHYFAQAVFDNVGRRCVFCGFEPRSLPRRSGLLRASHIKPWAKCTPAEQVDVRNGLAACPMHDAAFDQGYLTVTDSYGIEKASLLQESTQSDPGVALYFGESLHPVLLLPQGARRPAPTYLAYHREHIFHG